MLFALLSQMIGLGGGALAWSLAAPGLASGLWVASVIAGVIAALVGKILFRLPNWWLPINGIFIPATVVTMALDIPAWFYLAAFIVTLAVFWNVRSDQVPLYLTNRETWKAISNLLENRQGKEPVFIDLGCGIAGTLRYLASHHPNFRFVGVESAPAPYLIAVVRQWLQPRGNLTLRRTDIWSFDLSQVDVAYCFLSPAPMARLYDKAKREMKPGSMLISNSFAVPDFPPDQDVMVDDKRKTHLMIWHF